MKQLEQFVGDFSSALARVVARTGTHSGQITASLNSSGEIILTPVLDGDYDPKTAGVIWDSRFADVVPMLRQLAVKTSVQAACDAYVDVQILHVLWQAQVLAQHIESQELKHTMLSRLADLLTLVQLQSTLPRVRVMAG